MAYDTPAQQAETARIMDEHMASVPYQLSAAFERRYGRSGTTEELIGLEAELLHGGNRDVWAAMLNDGGRFSRKTSLARLSGEPIATAQAPPRILRPPVDYRGQPEQNRNYSA